MEFDFYTKDEINAMLGGLSFTKISQEDFDSLITKDADTIYYVYDDDGNITQYVGDAKLGSGNVPSNAVIQTGAALSSTVGTATQEEE